MSPKNSNPIEVRFRSDGLILVGTLHLPTVARPPVIIGCHGLYSTRNSPKQIALASACNAQGMAYFRIDHRGCGNSQGHFDTVTSLEGRCRDLKSAIDIIKQRDDTGRRIGLFGSSMGGTVCLAVAGKLKVRTIVTFAAPVRSAIHPEGNRRSASPDRGGIFLDAGQSDFDISANLPRISNILIFHGEADEIVPLAHALEIHRMTDQPKKLVVQPNGDHRMGSRDHQREFVRTATRWFEIGLGDQ